MMEMSMGQMDVPIYAKLKMDGTELNHIQMELQFEKEFEEIQKELEMKAEMMEIIQMIKDVWMIAVER